MECKSAYIRPKSFVMPELIDTLWNVNNSCHCLHSGEGCELIDTLWNVNYDVEKKSFHDVRINRYIMECKCHFGSRSRI